MALDHPPKRALILYRTRRFINHLLTYLLTLLKSDRRVCVRLFLQCIQKKQDNVGSPVHLFRRYKGLKGNHTNDIKFTKILRSELYRSTFLTLRSFSACIKSCGNPMLRGSDCRKNRPPGVWLGLGLG